jgi:hypothetical protein
MFRLFAPKAIARARTAPHLAALRLELRQYAHAASQSPIPVLSHSLWRSYALHGNRLPYDQPYFERRARLVALALHCTLEPQDEPSFAALEDVVYAIFEESTWASPPHVKAADWDNATLYEVIDLFASETAEALCETFDLLHGRFSVALERRLDAELERRVWQPFLRWRFAWEQKPNNWAAVCASNIGMTLLLRQAKKPEALFERIFTALEIFLSGYSEDGATAEGIAYWRYGFGYFVYFAEALNRATQGKHDLLAGEKIRAIAQFPNALGLAAGRFVNFSDAPEECPLEVGLLTFLQQRFAVAVPPSTVTGLHRDHCYRFAHVSRNLFWSTGNLEKPLEDGVFLFPELGWAIHRHNGLVLAIKGGHNDEPHNHNDLGQFVLHAHGETLLCDLGRGQYTQDYFGEQRYELLHPSSAGHNCARINGQAQAAGQEHRAEWLEASSRPESLELQLDLTKAYPKNTVRHYQRQFAWREGCLTLNERFEFESATNLLEFAFVSLFEPTIIEQAIIWTGTKAVLHLEYPDGMTAWFERLETKAHLGEGLVVYRVWLVASVSSHANLTFRLTLAEL